jgi:hypothetical protein
MKLKDASFLIKKKYTFMLSKGEAPYEYAIILFEFRM